MFTGIQSTTNADRLLAYILKDDRCEFATGYGCTATTAQEDFRDVREMFDPQGKLKVEAFGLVLSASTAEFDPNNPEEVYQHHQVVAEVVRRAFGGRMNLVGTQSDGSSGLVHSHGVVPNLAHEDAEMTHTVKGKKVSEAVVAGKPFSSAMSNVYRIRAITNEVLADEEFMASIGYDNSRLAAELTEQAKLNGKKFKGFASKHSYDNNELMRVSRSGRSAKWLPSLMAQIDAAKAQALDEERFVQLLEEDGTVALTKRGKDGTSWTFKHTDENGKVRSARAGSTRLPVALYGRETILAQLAANDEAAKSAGPVEPTPEERYEAMMAGAGRRQAAFDDLMQSAEARGQAAYEALKANRDADPVRASMEANRDARLKLEMVERGGVSPAAAPKAKDPEPMPAPEPQPEVAPKAVVAEAVSVDVEVDVVEVEDEAPAPKRRAKPTAEKPALEEPAEEPTAPVAAPEPPAAVLPAVEVTEVVQEPEELPEPEIEDGGVPEDRQSLLWSVDFDSHSGRKQKIIVAMAEFEEAHAWEAVAQGQPFDETKVPAGIGRAWMDEFGSKLDPAVSEQMWLRTTLKEEMAQEFERGADAQAADNDRALALSNLRHAWMKRQLEAGRYDISDEDRSAYLKAHMDERAALIEDPEARDQHAAMK